jgi:hypothetical protein
MSDGVRYPPRGPQAGGFVSTGSQPQQACQPKLKVVSLGFLSTPTVPKHEIFLISWMAVPIEKLDCKTGKAILATSGQHPRVLSFWREIQNRSSLVNLKEAPPEVCCVSLLLGVSPPWGFGSQLTVEVKFTTCHPFSRAFVSFCFAFRLFTIFRPMYVLNNVQILGHLFNIYHWGSFLNCSLRAQVLGVNNSFSEESLVSTDILVKITASGWVEPHVGHPCLKCLP